MSWKQNWLLIRVCVSHCFKPSNWYGRGKWQPMWLTAVIIQCCQTAHTHHYVVAWYGCHSLVTMPPEFAISRHYTESSVVSTSNKSCTLIGLSNSYWCESSDCIVSLSVWFLSWHIYRTSALLCWSQSSVKYLMKWWQRYLA